MNLTSWGPSKKIGYTFLANLILYATQKNDCNEKMNIREYNYVMQFKPEFVLILEFCFPISGQNTKI